MLSEFKPFTMFTIKHTVMILDMKMLIPTSDCDISSC